MQGKCPYRSPYAPDACSCNCEKIILELISESERQTEKLQRILKFWQAASSGKTMKFNWLADISILLALFKLLKKHLFITSDWEEFKAHFIGEHPFKKIQWLSYNILLGYLFKRLRKAGLIPPIRNPHIQISHHFKDRFGNVIPAASLRTLLERGVSESQHKKVIDEIVQDIINENNLPKS